MFFLCHAPFHPTAPFHAISPKGQSLETSVHVPVIIFLNRDKDIDRGDSTATLQPHLRYCSGTRGLFLSEQNSARVRWACIVYKRTFPRILCLDTSSIPVNKYTHTQTRTHYRGVKHVETNRKTCLLVICGILCSRIKLLSGRFCCFYHFSNLDSWISSLLTVNIWKYWM